MKKSVGLSPEVQERAVRMVVEAQGQHDSQWAAIESIAAKIGCTAETLRRWVRQHERDSERLAEAGIEPSVSSRGDSYDNALVETINALYKAELIQRRATWKTKESVELATLEWVSWFNHHRLLEPIGHMPPAEFEDAYYRQLAESAMSA